MDGCSPRALALTRAHNLLKNLRGEQLSEKVKSLLNQNTGGGDCYISPNSNNPSEDAYSPTGTFVPEGNNVVAAEEFT